MGSRLFWRVISVIGELLLTAGVIVLGFAAWFVWGTDAAAAPEHDKSVARLHSRFETPALPHKQLPVPESGREFAVITVPRFEEKPVPVVEGTDLSVLKRGIGHVPDSALPGEVGNFATAGHRVTYGRPYRHIDRLQPGDPIIVETAPGWSVYRFVRHQIVEPGATQVLAPVPDQPGAQPTQAWMTLVACHPPFSARLRYVGYALLERQVPRSQGPPAELSADAPRAAAGARAGTSGPVGAYAAADRAVRREGGH
ncbi:class E sortase [Gephyromycinifex aptenodytis]|uniref:class E sortase n=1 Tax=Gephyromycinifex aptenodytis TaxID=2716227 RepID=UPI0014464216|nr:class E sortase [Gephyromycinifex aptenodytis]